MRLMRNRTRYLLVLAAFVALAGTFDGISVAAIYEVGFVGVLRFVLAVLCIVVGTVSAFVLTAPLVRRITRQRDSGAPQ